MVSFSILETLQVKNECYIYYLLQLGLSLSLKATQIGLTSEVANAKAIKIEQKVILNILN